MCRRSGRSCPAPVVVDQSSYAVQAVAIAAKTSDLEFDQATGTELSEAHRAWISSCNHLP